MKKLLTLLILLSVLTITGCASKPEKEITLPPKPERSEIKQPETLRDYAQIIIYYEYLVQEWELWGTTVEDMVYGESDN